MEAVPSAAEAAHRELREYSRVRPNLLLSKSITISSQLLWHNIYSKHNGHYLGEIGARNNLTAAILNNVLLLHLKKRKELG